jgi:hypothetical protein
MTVWIIQSGEYEQRSIDGVAESVGAAVSFLKTRYPSERWGELEHRPYGSKKEYNCYVIRCGGEIYEMEPYEVVPHVEPSAFHGATPSGEDNLKKAG